MIRALEQTKYGSVQREMKARAELLVVVAGGWEAKLRCVSPSLPTSFVGLPLLVGCGMWAFGWVIRVDLSGRCWIGIGADEVYEN